MSKRKIIDTIFKNRALLTKYKVKAFALFGSYARKEQKKSSDVDFLVEFSEPTFRNYIGLLGDLRALLKSRVDLVCKDGLKPRIRSYILKDAEWLKKG